MIRGGAGGVTGGARSAQALATMREPDDLTGVDENFAAVGRCGLREGGLNTNLLGEPTRRNEGDFCSGTMLFTPSPFSS